jgi:hypothetical protein
MAAALHLTVTELVCVCTQPGWLEAWRAGRRPGTQVPGGDGIPLYGARLHLIAQSFVDWAVAGHNAERAAMLDTVAAIYARLQECGGEKLLRHLLKSGRVDAAARASENLERLASHFAEVRRNFPAFHSWADVYIAQEYALKSVTLWSQPGRVLRASGRIDALRHGRAQTLEIVDYKFSAGTDPQKELVQLALYQRLLQLQHGLRADGCLEYLWPHRQTTPCTAEQLEQIYRSQVEPVLGTLFGADRPSAPPPVPPRPDPSAPLPPIRLGSLRNNASRDLELDMALLARHCAVLGGTGSGKTTAALNIVEQALAAGVPAVLLDRKGDLCRYADDAAWQDASWALQHRERRARLRAELDIAVYTPGAPQGRALRLPLAPAGLAQLGGIERDLASRESAAALAQALKLNRPADQPKAAILSCAFQILSARITDRGILLEDLLMLLDADDPELAEAMGHLEQRHRRALLQAIQTFRIMSGALFDPRAESLDWSELLGRRHGRRPLTIISTKFLGDDGSTLFWVAQLFLELLRYVSRHPSERLQGLLMIDEADLYLPAMRSPATKAPLESLLRRARSGGIGLMLCTQSPGDLDYRGRDNIRSWLLGAIREARALEKLSGLLTDSHVASESLSRQKTGQFVLAAEGRATPFDSLPNSIQTRQMAEPDILEAARRSVRPGALV